MRCIWLRLASIILLAFLLSCGGGSFVSTNKDPGDPSITISPTSATLFCDQPQQFTASVTGLTNSSLIWTANGLVGGSATVGTITATGLYTAPCSFNDGTTVTVKAASVTDSTVNASATVTLHILTLSVSPKTATLNPGQTQQFTVTANSGNPNTVTWSVNEISGGNATIGTITATGLYTAPLTPPSPNTVEVEGHSTVAPRVECHALVTIGVLTPVLTSVSPTTLTAAMAFTLTLTGTNFTPSSQVLFGATPLPTTFVSSTQLTATGTAALTTGVLPNAPGGLFIVAITVVTSGAPPSNAINVTFTTTPVLTSVSPATVTAGVPFTLTVTGSSFTSSSKVTVGTMLLATTFVSTTQLTATGTVTTTGPFPVTVVTTGLPASNAINVTVLPAAATASGSSGVFVGTVGGQLVDEGYIPRSFCSPTFAPCVAVINLDATSSTGAFVTNVAMPAGYTPNATAVNQATAQVIVVSSTSPNVQIIDANKNTVVATLTAPVSGSAGFSGGGCTICGVLVNGSTNQAILDTAQGYVLLDLAKRTFATVPSTVAAENFTFNPTTGIVLSPTYFVTPTIWQAINLSNNSVFNFTGTVGNEPDAAAIDPVTNIAVVPDEFTQNDYLVNMQQATFTPGSSGSPGSFNAPLSTFLVPTTGTGCDGLWDYVSVEPSTHLLFTGTEFENCAGVLALPTSTVSGAPPTSLTFHWGILPHAPDATPFTIGGDPHGVAVFTSVVNGKALGFLVEEGQSWVARFDLVGIAGAPPLSGGLLGRVDLTPFIFFLKTQP